jgi:lysine 2,3-aminomutase
MADQVAGAEHFRTTVQTGIKVMEALRGWTSGLANPHFVIDAPGGGGKVPINPGYVLYHDNEKIVIRNYEGKIFEYPETGNENVQFAPQREYHDEYLYS